MASRDYPTHAPNCVCPGCFHSNGEQGARNKVLEEVAAICARNPSTPGAELAVLIRKMKWDPLHEGDGCVCGKVKHIDGGCICGFHKELP